MRDFYWSHSYDKSDRGLLTHLTHVHYDTPQLSYLKAKVRELKGTKHKTVKTAVADYKNQNGI